MSGLVLEGISKRFGGVTAVDHVDLAVPNGTFVCMLGPFSNRPRGRFGFPCTT